MKSEKKKYFTRLPFYIAIVYFLASIPITIYLAQQATRSNQYAQAGPTPTLPYVTPTYYCGGASCLIGSLTPTTASNLIATEGLTLSQSQASPMTTTDPCSLNPASVQNYNSQHHEEHEEKEHHGNKNGESFINFLKEFLPLINKFLELLGLPPINIGNPPVGGPSPTPGDTTPAPGNTTPAPTTGNITTPALGNTTPALTPGNTTPAPAPTTKPCAASTPATTPPLNTTPNPSISSSTNANVQITFYGSYDNDPQGSLNIKHPVIHQQAGGTGTYQDPLTFASPAGAGEYPWGTKIYVPLVQKYFIREDECAVSWTAPNGCGAVTHVDLYVGNPSSIQAVMACEGSLSGNGPIIINPPSTLTYDPTPIWDQSTGNCMTPH
jgi:hypothetical protein